MCNAVYVLAGKTYTHLCWFDAGLTFDHFPPLPPPPCLQNLTIVLRCS